MKKFLSTLFFCLVCLVIFAQAPQKFSYQAVVRDAGNNLVASHAVGVRISILQGGVTGNAVYMESQTITTNANGLMTVVIGNGTTLSGDIAAIDWANGPYFLKTETDPDGGTNYTIEGTQQLLSVPYALYAGSTTNSFSGSYNDLSDLPTIPTVPTNVSAFTNDAGYLTNASLPTNVSYFANDAQYVTQTALGTTLQDYATQADIPTVPTNVSAFTNDAGYITTVNVPTNVSAFVNDAGYITQSGLASTLTNYATTSSVPTNVSAFANDANYATVGQLPTIPTNVSAFTNDAGYITLSQVPAQVNADWNATSGAAKILNKPTIPTVPTNVSAFNNDAGYVTNSVMNVTLSNYATSVSIPTNVSAFTNDAGYITAAQAPAQVNADWNAASGAAQILNKPVIPAAANNGLLTIQKNGSTVGTFSANAATNATINIDVPTNVSAFTNDAGYITSADINVEELLGTLNARIDSLNNVIASMSGNPDHMPVPPTIITNEVSDVTTTTAVCSASIPNSGGMAVLHRGVCWSLNPNPTLSDNYMEASSAGTGNFTVNISGLSIGNTYYLRAYAVNSIGTAYGNEVIFLTPSYPTVTTANLTALNSAMATGGGNVTSTGGAAITARGVCWSTVQNPTISDAHTTDGTGIGSFSSTLTNLSANTTYYVRAYATNNAGTAYGAQKTIFLYMSEMPVVETNSVTNVEISTVSFAGRISADGGYAVTARGFCYGTSQNPVIENDLITTDGSGNGNFSHNVNGLSANTTYYVRAYATNLAGTSYGQEMTFTTKNIGQPCVGTPTVTDIDGNTYHTVQIGTQCWLKENMRTTRQPDGTAISNLLYPDGDVNNIATYGYLYDWTTALNRSTSRQGICPNGWHVPSDYEWTLLTNYVSSQDIFYCGSNSTSIAKSLASTTGWSSNSSSCTIGNDQTSNNATGFSALPAGYNGGNFGDYAYFWSSTEGLSSTAHYRNVYYGSAGVGSSHFTKLNNSSVRCVRD